MDYCYAELASGPNPPLLQTILPVASKNGQPIVGTVREEWIRDTAANPIRNLSYPAATLDQSKATMTVRVNESDARRAVPTTEWPYIDDTTVQLKQPTGTGSGGI